LPVPPRTVALSPETTIESWAPTQAVGVDIEILICQGVSQLVCDHRQLLPSLLACVQADELLDNPVQAPEQCLELTVCDLSVLHGRSYSRRTQTGER